jgi:hypothetical protein
MADSVESRRAAAEELRKIAQKFTKPPEPDALKSEGDTASPLHFVQERAREMKAKAKKQ